MTVSGESFLVPPGAVSDPLAAAIRQGHRPNPRTQHHRRHLGCALHSGLLVRSPNSASSGLTMHQADERVDLADLARLTEIYRNFLGIYFARP